MHSRSLPPRSRARALNYGHPLAEDLVLAYAFTEGGGDRLRNLANLRRTPGGTEWGDGILTNFSLGTAWQSGQAGPLLEFDGTDDYVEINDQLIDDSEPVTVSIWFSSTQNAQRTLWHRGYGTSWSIYLVQEFSGSSDNALTFAIYTSGLTTLGSVLKYERGEFHNAVCTWRPGEAKIFVNGQEGSSGSPAGNLRSSATGFRIGSPYSGSNYHNMRCIDFRVWRRVLSRKEILGLYEDPWALYRPAPPLAMLMPLPINISLDGISQTQMGMPQVLVPGGTKRSVAVVAG